MEARRLGSLFLALLLPLLLGAQQRTPNFVVETADPRLCAELAQWAEYYRYHLAVAWLGQPIPNWSIPCTMRVQAAPHLGAGGATTFVFDRGEVYGWKMDIQGSAERLVDSVLPHEITHMIFASHLRAPVPRWADEGGATNTECPSEKAKHQRMLIQFLQTNRGIAFSEMFAMSEYPPDVMPLYAQSHSLADFLIQQGGRQKYLQFVAAGMQSGQWEEAIRQSYAITDLGALQTTWLDWVRRGSPQLIPPAKANTDAVAQTTPRPRPEPNLILRLGKDGAAPTQQTAGTGSAVQAGAGR